MSSVNKKSVREEIDKYKSDFEALKEKGALSNEVRLLLFGLFALLDIIVALLLEKKTTKGKNNSHIPSSQSREEDNSATNNRRNNAKSSSANKGRFSHQKENTVTISLPVDFCAQCDEDLTGQEPDHIEERVCIDIIFEKHTTVYQGECKTCASCQATTKATFPSEISGPLQYGKGVRATIINFVIVQMIALGRASQMMAGLINHVISQATMLKYILQLHHALERWEKQSIDWLLTQQALHCDETSYRVDKKKQWVHSYSSGDVVLKFIHPKRGREAIEAIGIIPRYGGVLIHDCWSSYFSYTCCSHGLCGAHLLRELAFISESNEYRWAANMKRLLKKTRKTVSRRKRKKLTANEYKKLLTNYRNILTRGLREMPPSPKRASGQRGRIAKTDAQNLCERLIEHEESVLRFAQESEVSFTNNRAERDLRMGKVKLKVSGCFRQEQYAQAYCRISSYIQTMRYKGYHPLAAIEMALTGEIYKEGGE